VAAEGGGGKAWPHCLQKRAPGLAVAPQAGQVAPGRREGAGGAAGIA